MAETTQMGERILYTSQDGKVLVTTKKVALGDEQWETANIVGAGLVTRKKPNFHNWLKINERTIPSIVVGGVSLLLGFLFAWLAIGTSGVLYALLLTLALLMYVIAFFFVWRTWMMSLPDLYNLRLTLQNPTGAQSEHKAAYTWSDPLQAREVEQAVLQVIAHK